MNAEQLNSARLARWSQNGEARLTLEAAAEWLGTIGFCPYLPAGAREAFPAPSFLEAVVGRPAQTPSAGERSRANELLRRLVENSAAVPLKLGNSLGEQPDSVASPEAFKYVYALRGDRNFKAGPSTIGNDKVTPLALHCWEAIKEHGALDVPALQPILGRDITEAAIARALQELWVGLNVFPVGSTTGKPARWELLSRCFQQQVSSGANTGQAEAQSAMVSLYLHAVVAAAEEEVLAFLSPLASQSKLREVIRGLGSMRQLDIIDIGGRSHVCLQGGLLPEMVAQLSEEQLGVPPEETQQSTAGIFEGGIEIEREPQNAHRPDGEARRFVPKKFVPKKFVRESGRGEPARKGFGARTSSAGGAGRFLGSRSAGGYRSGGEAPSRPRSFAASAGASASRGPDFKRSDSDRPRSTRPAFDARKPSTRGPGERAKRWEKAGEGAGGRPFSDRTSDRKSNRKPPFKSSGFKPAGSGAAKPWAKRPSFTPDAPREHDSDERSKRSEKPEGPGRPATGYKKPYAAKPFGSKPGGFKARGFKPAGSKPWASKAGAPRSGAPKRWDKSTRSDGEGRSEDRAGGGRPQFVTSRPAGQKSWGAKPGGRKPSGFTSSGFKSAGAKSAEGRAAGSKPWVSRGAESRVGSAKSYAERKSRNPEGETQREPRKSYGKPDGAKPWTKRRSSERSDSRGDAGDSPKRREKPAIGAHAGEKRAAKPFWAKNPRGGKGSVAALRTNRPRGGKKSGGKKK